MKQSDQAVLVSTTRNLKRIAREKGPNELSAYVSTREFRDALASLQPANLQTVLAAYANAVRVCDAKAPLPKPWTVKRAKWDAAMIAKLRHAWTKAGTDEGVARLLGITRGAAKLARHRYLDASATQHMRLAA